MTITVMDIYEIRRRNLQHLADTHFPGHGQKVKLAAAMGWKQPRASALLRDNNPKNMGGTAARLIERHFKLPRGWLDEAHSNIWSGRADNEIAEPSPVYVTQVQTLPLLNPDEIGDWCSGVTFDPRGKIAFPILPMMALSSRAYVIEETTNSMPPQKPGDFYYVDPEQKPETGKWAVYLFKGRAVVGIYEMGNAGPRLTFTNPREPELVVADLEYAGRVLTRMDGDFAKQFSSS